MRPIAILYENEARMAPLFGALDDIGAPYERVFLNELSFDPHARFADWLVERARVGRRERLLA